jgi:DNA repair protein RadC
MKRTAPTDEASPVTPSLVHEPPLRAWPSEERPRERLEALGVRQLADAELLAMILRTGGVGASALTLARKLQSLAAVRGGFRHLQAADLRAVPGIGAAKAAAVLAALEWGLRQQGPERREAALRGPAAACEALRALLAGRQQEQVAVLALDTRRRVLARELVSQGTLTQSLAHPREIFRTAIKLGAAAVVVGHNHPSGDPSPSPDDHALTRRLREAAEVLGIPLVDHIVVGQDGFYSYADSGWNC